ncbi:MAG: DNA polymerase III subunit delta [Gemmatimonadales bacterium]|jgi:DNA polymerase-3 subunit delta
MSLAADQRLDRILERGEFSGAFFLHGEAGRLRDDAARRLADAAVDPSTRDFNLDTFHGSDVSPEALASALAMPPVMAPRRVILLFEAEKLTATGRKVVENVLPKLPDDVTFIVVATIPDRTKAAYYRNLKKQAVELEWKAPREAEIPGWLIERARQRFDRELAPDAAGALADAVGADLGILDTELEKLAGVADGTIDLALVKSLVPNVREVNRWDWINDVAARRYERARRLLPDLLATPGENAVGLLIFLVEQHLLIGVAVEGGAGLVGRTLDYIKKPYLKWKTRDIVGQAKAWTTAEIDTAMVALLQADRRAKTGGTDREALDELLLRLQVERDAGHSLRVPA